MVAYIRKRVVGQRQWLDPDSFHAGVALCQAIHRSDRHADGGLCRPENCAACRARCAVPRVWPAGVPLNAGVVDCLLAATPCLPLFRFHRLQTVIVAVGNATVPSGRPRSRTGSWADRLGCTGAFPTRVNPGHRSAGALLGLLLQRQTAGTSEGCARRPNGAHRPPVALLSARFRRAFALLFCSAASSSRSPSHVQDRSSRLWGRVCLGPCSCFTSSSTSAPGWMPRHS